MPKGSPRSSRSANRSSVESSLDDRAAEEREAHPYIVLERGEAPITQAPADQQLLIAEKRGGDRNTRGPHPRVALALPGSPERKQRSELQCTDHHPIEPAEQNRSRLDASLHVVVAIHHRVHRVVRDDPQHAADEEEP